MNSLDKPRLITGLLGGKKNEVKLKANSILFYDLNS